MSDIPVQPCPDGGHCINEAMIEDLQAEVARLTAELADKDQTILSLNFTASRTIAGLTNELNAAKQAIVFLVESRDV